MERRFEKSPHEGQRWEPATKEEIIEMLISDFDEPSKRFDDLMNGGIIISRKGIWYCRKRGY